VDEAQASQLREWGIIVSFLIKDGRKMVGRYEERRAANSGRNRSSGVGMNPMCMGQQYLI
jgi:hypothetical protein